MGKPYGIARNTLVICRAQSYCGLPFVGRSVVLACAYASSVFSSVHLFYAWRIHRLGRTYVLPWAVVFVSSVILLQLDAQLTN